MLIFDVCKDRSKHHHHRSKSDLIADILTVVNEQPIGKTRIMKTVCLNGGQGLDYVSELLSSGLLSYNEVTRTYHTTAQGTEYLRLYEAMKNL